MEGGGGYWLWSEAISETDRTISEHDEIVPASPPSLLHPLMLYPSYPFDLVISQRKCR